MDKINIEEMFANPYYAINISPSLMDKHEPLTTKENWVKANMKLMSELGQEEWLNRLLIVLESKNDETREK